MGTGWTSNCNWLLVEKIQREQKRLQFFFFFFFFFFHLCDVEEEEEEEKEVVIIDFLFEFICHSLHQKKRNNWKKKFEKKS